VALDGLQDLDVNEDILRAEWKAQIAHPTRPIPRKSFTSVFAVLLIKLYRAIQEQGGGGHYHYSCAGEDPGRSRDFCS
jgi:hypothetical protein